MKLAESLKNLSTSIIGKAVSALDDFKSALEDQSRMCEKQNEIAALSSYEFVNAFNCVARLICSARILPFADTYCGLAETAIQMLAKGEKQEDVLYYFDKLYVKETAGDTE